MTFTRDVLERLDSATRYPSIDTYHKLGKRGVPTDEVQVDFGDDPLIAHEKIDGINARILFSPDGDAAPLIGSRKEWLASLDDTVQNPALGIVDTVRPVAWRFHAMAGKYGGNDQWLVVYGEVFGGSVGGKTAHNYTTDPTRYGFRMFDAAFIPYDIVEKERDAIAEWRDHGGQQFVDVPRLRELSTEFAVDMPPEVWRWTDGVDPLPSSAMDTAAWLDRRIRTTGVALDDSGKGRPEGVVVRAASGPRGLAKIRFEDYRRLSAG